MITKEQELLRTKVASEITTIYEQTERELESTKESYPDHEQAATQKEELDIQKKEITALREERNAAASQGQSVKLGNLATLTKVETDILYRGSLNTILWFDNGGKKTIKVSTFDKKNRNITKKALKNLSEKR